MNIGVESELYTRFREDDAKDTSIEKWFAGAIDGPATRMVEHLLDPSNIDRRPFRGLPQKERLVKSVGFKVNPYVEWVSISSEVRSAISEYISALLVRHPRYLTKLTEFHRTECTSATEAKNRALDNMLRLFDVYRRQVARSVFILTRRVGEAEYLYADGGLHVEEPWRQDFNIPFDIHAPITPDLALQVLPVPLRSSNDLSQAAILESTNQGVARQNRIILGCAQRFVFSRQKIPASFIANNFGKPAPKNIGYRVDNGQLQTFFDPKRV